MKRKLGEVRFLLKPILILSAVYLLAMAAILRTDFYYIDDLGRAAQGYTGWGNPYSRYISVYSSYFLHADRYLTDISPLPQILGAVIIAMASIVAVYGITDEKKISVWHMIAAIPIGISPYFLECLSYKYDAPYMALSVLFSVLPVLFLKKKTFVYACAAFIGTLGMCNTYQASSGIFPMLVIAIAIRMWIENEDFKRIAEMAAVSAIGYLAGMIFFRIFFVRLSGSEHSTTTVPFAELIPVMIRNYKSYVKYLLSDFKSIWLYLMGLQCVFAGYAVVRWTKRNRIITAVVGFVAFVLMFMLSFGVYPALAEPGFSPRCMYGVGCYISFVSILVIMILPKALGPKLVSFMLAWCFFSFSFTYGNALNAQKEYTDFRTEALIQDLVSSGAVSSTDYKGLQLTGTVGYAPIIRNMPQNYGMLNRLVPVQLCNSSWCWGTFELTNYYGLALYICYEDLTAMEMPLMVDNALHTIYANESYIRIELH